MAAEILGDQAAGMLGEARGLAAGSEAAREAAEAGRPVPSAGGESPAGPMAAPANSAQQAANAFAQAALSAMQSMGVPGGFMPGSTLAGGPQPGQDPGQQPADRPGEGEGTEPGDARAQATQASAPVPPGLAELGLTADDWARIRGAAQSAIGDGGSSTVPAEYQELVRDYFEALVRGTGRDGR
jgi:hypothetical protein